MIASLVILIIIVGVVLRLYLNGTVLNTFVTLICVLAAMALALGYYEVLVNVMLTKGILIKWASSISLLAIFGISFVILRVIGGFVTGTAIHFSNIPDKIICCGIGAVYATIATGILLLAVSMSPIPSKWTHSRFDTESFDLDSPSGVLIPVDSFVTSLFSSISGGSMKTDNSFSSMHPNFLNQIHLNNLHKDEGVLSVASEKALAVKKNGAYWTAQQSYIDSSTGERLGEDIVIVRAAVKSGLVEDGGAMGEDDILKFSLGQFRLITADSSSEAVFDGADTKAVYPLGYVKTKNQVEVKDNLAEIIEVARSSFSNHEGFGNSFLVDLVFEMPNNQVPVALAFKNNAIVGLGQKAKEDEIPDSVTFIQVANCKSELAEIAQVGSRVIEPTEISSENSFSLGLRVNLNAEKLGETAEARNSELTISSNEFICGKAKLTLDSESVSSNPPRRPNSTSLSAILATMKGYANVAVSCKINNPTATIDSSNFPVLLDVQGNEHYPVGVVSGGRKDGNYVYQLDYCSVGENLNIVNGVVTQSYVDELWITGEIDKIEETFFYYQVSVPESSKIIMNVIVDGRKVGFKDCEGFLIEKTAVRR